MNPALPPPANDPSDAERSPEVPPVPMGSLTASTTRIPAEDAIPILTDEVDVFWEFDDRDTRNDPSVKPLLRHQ